MNISHQLRIESNKRLTHKTYVMTLIGEKDLISQPGQFVNIGIEGKFLRRPISVCDYTDEGCLTLLYDVVGDGTSEMSRWEEGRNVDILMPLGNGFDTTKGGEFPLLLGGGIGIAPLYMLSKRLIAEGRKPTILLGFNSAGDIAWIDEFRSTGAEVEIATMDGSAGVRGYVTDIDQCHRPEHKYFYACGPLPMLRALCTTLTIDGEISMESRMGCGFGVCVCCSLETRGGSKRICKEGPVFKKEELIWK